MGSLDSGYPVHGRIPGMRLSLKRKYLRKESQWWEFTELDCRVKRNTVLCCFILISSSHHLSSLFTFHFSSLFFTYIFSNTSLTTLTYLCLHKKQTDQGCAVADTLTHQYCTFWRMLGSFVRTEYAGINGYVAAVCKRRSLVLCFVFCLPVVLVKYLYLYWYSLSWESRWRLCLISVCFHSICFQHCYIPSLLSTLFLYLILSSHLLWHVLYHTSFSRVHAVTPTRRGLIRFCLITLAFSALLQCIFYQLHRMAISHSALSPLITQPTGCSLHPMINIAF